VFVLSLSGKNISSLLTPESDILCVEYRPKLATMKPIITKFPVKSLPGEPKSYHSLHCKILSSKSTTVSLLSCGFQNKKLKPNQNPK